MSSRSSSKLSTMALAALGVVYGDIGTSPLYTIKEVFAGGDHPVPITPDNILGILSLVFWSLMMVVTVKYVSFVMRADNKGEGGIMALMALALRPSPEGSRRRIIIPILGLFGAALFFGEGVVTPAISVLSAVEGLQVATPALKDVVIPVTLVVILVLFLFQKKGTGGIGALFGPIMTLWFATLTVLGLTNIIAEPDIMWALNPLHGLGFMFLHPLLGFFALGGVVLAVTGTEALYADMGHFGRRPIQIAWIGLVLPALVLNYFGQGALLLHDPKTIQNPFYLMAPNWALYPLVAIATIATVIASQAVISGAFSVTQQMIQLGYAPRFEVQHTSDREIGQIYLPGVNWTVFVAVVALVIGFRTSSNLAGAYGTAVTGTMFITDILAICVTRWLWHWPWWRSILGALPFLCIDFSFFSANLVKIIAGGWFPLLFGSSIFLLLTTWKKGRRLLYQHLEKDALDLKSFIDSLAMGGATRVPGTAIFMTPNPDGVPQALLHSLKHYKVVHERMVLVTVTVLDVAHVPESQRVNVESLPSNFWRINVYYGFMDDPDLPQALEWCAEQGLELDMMDTSFFLGRETLIPRLGAEMTFWREKLFIAMYRNAGSVTNFFKLPANRVVELGSQVVL